jgi:putative transposase
MGPAGWAPRTVRAYWSPEPERRGNGRTCSQNWRTFVRNHAESLVACDFLVVVTARFRTGYVFLLMEVGARRIVHCNVTAHPTATWTLQRLREAIPSDHSYRFLIHDRSAHKHATLVPRMPCIAHFTSLSFMGV